MFQSTHPCGVRHSHPDGSSAASVSIHAPVWGATRILEWVYHPDRFQSTHPCGVRLAILLLVGAMLEFQSTHPCGVRQIGTIETGLSQVSIHAPVWGATSRFGMSSKKRQFQSTHPCGVRPIRADKFYIAPPVSIHAPVWGATSQRKKFDMAGAVSIHAPVWGATSDR